MSIEVIIGIVTSIIMCIVALVALLYQKESVRLETPKIIITTLLRYSKVLLESQIEYSFSNFNLIVPIMIKNVSTTDVTIEKIWLNIGENKFTYFDKDISEFRIENHETITTKYIDKNKLNSISFPFRLKSMDIVNGYIILNHKLLFVSSGGPTKTNIERLDIKIRKVKLFYSTSKVNKRKGKFLIEKHKPVPKQRRME